MGRIGLFGLCIFTSPLMEGAEGFKLTYFHLLSHGISVLLSFIVFLICVWNALVGSVVVFWKLFSSKKFRILDSYCVIGTTELPLSARVIMALLFCSLDWIDFISLDSGCMLWLGFGLFCRCSVSVRSATSFL